MASHVLTPIPRATKEKHFTSIISNATIDGDLYARAYLIFFILCKSLHFVKVKSNVGILYRINARDTSKVDEQIEIKSNHSFLSKISHISFHNVVYVFVVPKT